MVGTEAVVILLLCGFLLLLIAISSWYRRRKAKDIVSSLSRIHETVIDGQRTFRIATVSRQVAGQLTLDVYEVRIPRPGGAPSISLVAPPLPPRNRNASDVPPSSPPPTFSRAVNMPSPSTAYINNNEDSESTSDLSPPPPRYDEVIPVSTISRREPSAVNNYCIVTVDPSTSTIINP